MPLFNGMGTDIIICIISNSPRCIYSQSLVDVSNRGSISECKPCMAIGQTYEHIDNIDHWFCINKIFSVYGLTNKKQDAVYVSTWVSSGFSGFLSLPKNTWVGGVARLNWINIWINDLINEWYLKWNAWRCHSSQETLEYSMLLFFVRFVSGVLCILVSSDHETWFNF